MNEPRDTLQEVTIGKVKAASNFAVFPLFMESTIEPGYSVLSDAIRAGSAVLKEVSDGGTVPTLIVENKSDRPVLLVDGEQLIGCKQNRILNLSILAPASSSITIPVSCVEQGRWRYDSAHFRDSGQALYAGLRAKKAVQVSRSLASRGVAMAVQQEIWSDLAMKAERLGSTSSTGAMSGIFERREAHLQRYVRAAGWQAGQVGAMFSINGRFVGVELFDSDVTCSKYLGKIAYGFALDAIDYFTPVYPMADERGGRTFLEQLIDTRQTRFKAAGLGDDVRLEAEECTGAALVVEERVVHFCGFNLAVDSDIGADDPYAHPLASAGFGRRGLRRRFQWGRHVL